MTEQEIERFEQYELLRNEQNELIALLESLQMDNDHTFDGVSIYIRERGIASTSERIDLPDDLANDIFEQILETIRNNIGELEFKIKAL